MRRKSQTGRNVINVKKGLGEEKLKDEHELQSWFIKEIEKFILSKNKKLVGWDEILRG